jgi:hypothetical protein
MATGVAGGDDHSHASTTGEDEPEQNRGDSVPVGASSLRRQLDLKTLLDQQPLPRPVRRAPPRSHDDLSARRRAPSYIAWSAWRIVLLVFALAGGLGDGVRGGSASNWNDALSKFGDKRKPTPASRAIA